jgi:hypothetical protein
MLTVAKLRYQQSQKEGDRFLALATDEIKSLRKTNADKLDFLNTLKRPEQSGKYRGGVHPLVSYQQLGGWYGQRG